MFSFGKQKVNPAQERVAAIIGDVASRAEKASSPEERQFLRELTQKLSMLNVTLK